MKTRRIQAVALGVLGFVGLAFAQPPGDQPPRDRMFGGPPGGAEKKIVKDFDKDKNGWLDNEERKAARAELKKGGGERRGGRGGFGGGGREPGKPGPKVEPGEVEQHPGKPLYEQGILRTLFLTFENSDWEKELEEFHGTDVEVPCTLQVDGKTYANVGVHFRGMSSYMGVPPGLKRSFGMSVDLANKKQRLYGAKNLNLLNANGDPSFLSTVLYSHIAREHIPAPKANVVRVVINGELWGVYSSVQQFDAEFLKENYKTDKGTRWKVRGSPGGRGGMEYLGDKIDDYKRIYEIKSKDDEKAWKALINLCKVLKETPADKLSAALEPICNVEGLLWFLALDVALVNEDGFWTRASDYSIYLDAKGKIHFIPHDMNESFHGGGGPGGGGMFIAAPPMPGEILPAMFRELLKLTDDQKKQIDALQKEIDSKLEAILTEDQKKQMKEMRSRQPGGVMTFGPGGPDGPPGGGGGRGGPPGGGGGGGPGGGGLRGPMMGGGGVKLDPLVGLTDERKPLRSKVLAVPAYKEKYLANVRTLADKSLDWKNLGPVVQKYRDLLEQEVQKDTRKLTSFEAFQRVTADKPAGEARGRELPLRSFADQRRAYLLEATAKKETK